MQLPDVYVPEQRAQEPFSREVDGVFFVYQPGLKFIRDVFAILVKDRLRIESRHILRTLAARFVYIERMRLLQFRCQFAALLVLEFDLDYGEIAIVRILPVAL